MCTAKHPHGKLDVQYDAMRWEQFENRHLV